MLSSSLYALAASLSTVSAVYTGFNYGSTATDGSAVSQAEFESLFTTASNLVGTSGFTSARLYTMIQADTTNGIIEAIPAAINTKTSLLLGMWASAGQANFDNELAALKSTIATYGQQIVDLDLLAGISVGSEDLYRISPTGIINKSGAGANPADLVSYISQVRAALAGTVLADAVIGHVDTWTAWVNGSNDAVINACDFLGMDAYPYFQTTIDNGIDVGNATFWDAYDNTVGASNGKPVWITETGWPVSGPTENLAVASLANAETYWDEVACTAIGTFNTYWYTLQDAGSSPSFGVVGSTLSTTPLYDLTCPNKASSSSSESSTATSTSVTSATVATFSATSASLISTDTSIVGTASLTSEVLTTTAEADTSATEASATGAPISATGSAIMTTVVVLTTYPVTSTGESTTFVDYTTDVITITSEATAEATTVEASVTESAAETTAQATAETIVEATASATSATSGACSTDILASGAEFQYPHLIIPVNSAEPTEALGTSYFGEVSSTVSSIFNFDVPESYAGKTCTLMFLFPTQSELTTSSFTLSGAGGLEIKELSTPATEATNYDTVPSAAGVDVTFPSVTPGNSYTVAPHACGAGERISFEVSATGSLNLRYFQDYNASPIGLYISAC